MKIIAIERELKPVPADTAADLYRAEAKQVFTLYKQDILRDIHMTEARCAISRWSARASTPPTAPSPPSPWSRAGTSASRSTPSRPTPATEG